MAKKATGTKGKTATAVKASAKASPSSSKSKSAGKPAAKPAAKAVAKAAAKTPAKKTAAAAKPAPKAAKPAAKASKSTEKETPKSKAPLKAVPTKAEKGETSTPSGKKAAKAEAPVLKAVPKTLSAQTPEEEAEVEVEVPEQEAEDTSDAAKASLGTEKAEKKKRKDDIKIDRTGDLEQQWKVLFDKAKGVKAVPYKMSDNYEAKTALLHKVLGWGFVLTSQNNRLEVLFKDGIKILIANYKA